MISTKIKDSDQFLKKFLTMSIIALGFTLLCPNLPEITLQVFFRRLVFNSGEEQIPDPINPVERSPCREQKDSWPKQFRRFQDFKESPLLGANFVIFWYFLSQAAP